MWIIFLKLLKAVGRRIQPQNNRTFPPLWTTISFHGWNMSIFIISKLGENVPQNFQLLLNSASFYNGVTICFSILSGSWKPYVCLYLMKSSLVPPGYPLMLEIYENKKMLLLKGWCGKICGYCLSYLSFCPAMFKNV